MTGRRRTLVALALLAAVLAGCEAPGAGSASTPGSRPAAGDTGPSATAPPAAQEEPTGRVRSGLVAFGDFGGGDAQPAVARAMERWAAGHRVDALVTTGDNVYERGEPEKFAAQLDQPYQQLRRGRPLWVTLGNHDVKGGHGAQQLRHLGLPDLPYAKSLPGLQVLVLDANRVDAAQASWLDARLGEPGPALRVVVFHHPAWSCSKHDSDEEVARRWRPVIERHRVALVLNGHDHNYQRFVSERGVTYVVTGGGGRSLYPLEACPIWAPRRAAQAVRHHFVAVEVRDGSLTLTAVADDGAVLDRAVIRR
jgi:3',5'-cyclic AMP phosphodiesterase CpdA